MTDILGLCIQPRAENGRGVHRCACCSGWRIPARAAPLLPSIRSSSIAGGYEKIGQTGDVVVYRKTGDEVVLLAPSENGSVAATAPRTISAENGGQTVEAAVRGTSGEARIRDANGQDVWAIWRSLPALDIGILVKIVLRRLRPASANEGRRRDGRRVCHLHRALAAILLARWMVGPIVGLKDATRQLVLGNFSERCGGSRGSRKLPI